MRGSRHLLRGGLACAAAAGFVFLAGVVFNAARADVSPGSADKARKYFRELSGTIGFSSPDGIFNTTLDDVAAYLGYDGLTGADMQNLPSDVLMEPAQLLEQAKNRDKLAATLGGKLKPDDILVSRFFAPKIVNIHDPPATRKLGWRKMVRLKARAGSPADKHDIVLGIVLFNIFTDPGQKPFESGQESVNTQVILSVEPSKAKLKTDDVTLYWLDYDKLSAGNKLSLALNASFDANELSGATQDYFVPDGCVACHGANLDRSMLNYLDTDHWFDRLDNDFQDLKKAGIPILFDAGTNDFNSAAYKKAFDVIRRFNEEADKQAENAQPKHDEVAASRKWLELHKSSDAHFPPIERAIGPPPQWSAGNANEVQLLGILNQYCFRCHGSVKFSVFSRQSVQNRRVVIKQRIDPNAPLGVRMPTDRPLPPDLLDFVRANLP